MTPTPSPLDVQKLTDIETRVKAGTETLWDGGNGITAKRSEILWLIKRIRQLEADNQKMTDTLLAISSGAGCGLHQCGLWASKALPNPS